ncbi:hypothetical protein HN587_06510 [Candidatus Woesearchaeota archaeon]|jgi:hypothetical protein|nr:hypothetical protein [Candidatus Woesearchaeota archaeon]
MVKKKRKQFGQVKFKKAQISLKLLKSLVIAIMGLLLLLGIIFLVKGGSEDIQYNTRCKSSVQSHARMISLDLDDQPGNEIDCPTKYLTLKGSKEAQLKKEFANEIFYCWNNFGEGKLQLFSATDDKFCVVCSVISFQKKDLQLERFDKFLQTKKIPVKIRDRRYTYAEYVSGGHQTNTGVVDNTGQPDNTFLDTSKTYAVLFTYFKESYWSKLKGALWGAGIAMAAIIVVGVVIVATGGSAAPLVALVLTKAGSLATAAIVVSGGAAGASAVDGNTLTSGADWDARLIITEWNAQDIAKFKCNSLEGKSSGKFN